MSSRHPFAPGAIEGPHRRSARHGIRVADCLFAALLGAAAALLLIAELAS